jgi:hypothetical protein
VDPALPGLETDRTLGPGADAEGVRASGAGAGVGAAAEAVAFGAVLAASTRDVRPFAGGLRGGADILSERLVRVQFNRNDGIESTSEFLFPRINSFFEQRYLYALIVYFGPLSSIRRPIHTTMPRPNDSPDVATSKTLAYILRHGAEKESLHIRTDGYIKLDDVVSAFYKQVGLRDVCRNADD